MVSIEEQAVISDIIGVAGAGFRLSLILNAVSCEVDNDGLEVHNISKTVTLFALTLKNVGISLQSADSVHTVEALEGVRKISDDAIGVFDQFNEMLDRVRTKPPEGSPQHSILQRFQWCFKRHRVQYLLGQLDCLKMDASLFQQILSLGKLMASTNKNDSPEEVALKQELIRQERAESQNVLIVRYWQKSKMEGLWEALRLEEDDLKVTEVEHDNTLALVSSNGHNHDDQRLAIEAPPIEYATSMALVKLPTYSLGELDQRLDGIKKSSKDMVQISADVLEPLLERWTRWYEVREERHAREAKSRYVPTVDNLHEDDDDGMHPYRKYNGPTDTASQPKGYFLEGKTTDWRQPQSAEARQQYSRRKKEYSRYQPSISVENSDDDTNSNGSRKKAPRRHIIDSSSESEISDHDMQTQHRPRKRHGSNSPTQERSYPIFQHAHSPRVQPGSPMTGRPHPHHAYTAPGPGYPPINGANAHNPYASSPTTGPGGYPLQHYNTQPPTQPYPPLSTAHTRYTPATVPAPTNGSNRIPVPQPYAPSLGYTNRPLSRDGPASMRPSSYAGGGGGYPTPPGMPSRHSSGTIPTSTSSQNKAPSSFSSFSAQQRPAHDRDNRLIHYDAQNRPFVVDERGREIRANLGSGGSGAGKHNKLTEGATKGLLGAGAIAGFLEALEGLSI